MLPVNRVTLKFINSETESYFHKHFFQDEKDFKFINSEIGLESDFCKNFFQNDEDLHNVPTLAQPRYSLLINLIVSLLFYSLISLSLFLAINAILSHAVRLFFIACGLVLYLMSLIIATLLIRRHQLLCGRNKSDWWYSRQIIGAVITSLPVLSVYVSLSQAAFNEPCLADNLYWFCMIVSLVHFCNFTLLSCWLKSLMATTFSIMLTILLFLDMSYITGDNSVKPYYHSNTTDFVNLMNYNVSPTEFSNTIQHDISAPYAVHTNDLLYTAIISSQFSINSSREQTSLGTPCHLRFEIFVSVGLLLILIWFLNYELEKNYRLNFFGEIQAREDRRKVEYEKTQSDTFLLYIIPSHVLEAVKSQNSNFIEYSRHYSNVGVIFAGITNFDDLYEEQSFNKGIKYLHVLDEIMVEFDKLLDDNTYPQYGSIEKIKTVGCCFIAASGTKDDHEHLSGNAHLHTLMDFAMALLKQLDEYNERMKILSVQLKMKIGFNVGELVGGVIGKIKPYYDIWGDTVNMASRMYSTGEPGKIQVTKDVSKILEDKFEFERERTINVKGKKRPQNVVFLVGKKSNSDTLKNRPKSLEKKF